MNYPTFLKKVDQLSSQCDADSLRQFVHEIARKLPESNRRQFLAKLSEYSDVSTGEPAAKTEKVSSLAARVDSLIRALEKIQVGGRELVCEYNEDGYDWRDEEEDDEDSYRFTDPDNVLDDVAKAVKALHQCLAQKEYAKGSKLANLLSELTVRVSGDYCDDEMKLYELVYYKALKVDLKKVIKEAIYATCMGTRDEKRAEAMLTVMDQFDDYSISLDEILQTGSEEIELDSLLPSWIEALARRSASKADKLLLEAQKMLRDKNDVLENASQYAESHPILYQNLLRAGVGNDDPKEKLRIGLRAMKEIPIQRPTRSKISLLTAEYALAAKKRQTAEDCWLEAFRTSPTAVNYLRLRLESSHWKKYAADVRDIYTAYYKTKREMNRLPLAALMFFDERFDEMILKFMKPGKGIGWSDTFMKGGIALLLMLMDTGKTKRPGTSRMPDLAIDACSFDSESYCKGTDLKRGVRTATLFQDCFQKWKAQVAITDDDSELWLKKIDKWLALRVSAIMEAKRSNYYGECAAFLAAYGEVLESRGKPGEKDRIMQQYNTEYSRRYSFREALRRYGMRQ